MKEKNIFNFWKNDVPAGLVVFLIALPLCLGIAAVSKVPAFSGIIAGIIGGIIVGVISGSQLGVSGPAAGLAVIVADSLVEMGGPKNEVVSASSSAFQMFLLAVMLAGAIQFILGLLKGGIIGYYFPNSVIKGMLAGIGITIFLKEVPHALGYDADMEGDLSFYQIDGENTFSELFNAFGNPDFGAVIISLIGLAILILWGRPFMKKNKIFNIIQGPLIALIAGIVCVFAFRGSGLEIVKDHFVDVPVASSSSEFFGFFTFPMFEAIGNPLVWKTAVVIAVVASLETLLCLEATDKLDPEKRVSPTNLELKAQGIGNMVSGLIGGLPITQVIVRSSANIQSNAKSKMSAVYHGFFLLGFVAFFPDLLNMIPRASLAAILLVVGYKLAKPKEFKATWNSGLAQFLPFIATVLIIVFKDLLWGVSIGLVIAIFEILYLNLKKPYLVNLDKTDTGDHFKFNLAEDVTFLHKASIQNTLRKIPDGSSVEIDATKSVNIHPDVIEIIEDFATHAGFSDIDVEIKGLESIDLDNPVKQFDKLVS